MEPMKWIACGILLFSLFSSSKWLFFYFFDQSKVCCVCIESQLDTCITWKTSIFHYFPWNRYGFGVLCMLKPNGKHREMLEYDQNMWARRRCVSYRDPMGKSTIFLTRCSEAVLRIEAMLHEETLLDHSPQVYAILYAYLVWGLDMLGMLPGWSL